MMHVMQPVVLPDGAHTGWPAKSSTTLVAAVPDAQSDAAATAAAVTPGGGGGSSELIVDGSTRNVVSGSSGASSFQTLNRADVCGVHSPTTDDSSATASLQPTPAHLLQKPPKKPCTPYLRFSKAVRCYAA